MTAIGPEEVRLMKEFLTEVNNEIHQEKSEDYHKGYAEGVNDLCALFGERWKIYVEGAHETLLCNSETDFIMAKLAKENEKHDE